MTPISVLDAARALLADEKRWTRGAAARNAEGLAVPVRHHSAVCWDVLGAVRREAAGDAAAYQGAWDALAAELKARGEPHYLLPFNDNATHAEVLRLLELAAARLRKSEEAA